MQGEDQGQEQGQEQGQQPEQQQEQTKRDSFKETFKRVRAESGLNILRILATALAAVTMAVISSRLTTVMNSLILTGVVSIGSALVNEFYRTVLTVGAERTKTVVAPIIGAEEAHKHAAASEDETQVLPAVQETSQTTQVHRAEPVGVGTRATGTTQTTATESSVGETGARETAVSGTAVSGTGASGAGAAATTSEASEPQREVSKAKMIWERMRHNQVVQMSLIFAIVSLITLGVSYTMAAKAGGTEVKVNRTEISQSLSEEDKQALVDRAVDAAKGKGGQDVEGDTGTQPDPNEQTETDQPTVNMDDLDSTEQMLEAQITELQNENAALQGTIADLQNALAAESAKTDELLRRLEALEQAMNQQPDAFDSPTN